jgi:hypothetical protein
MVFESFADKSGVFKQDSRNIHSLQISTLAGVKKDSPPRITNVSVSPARIV